MKFFKSHVPENWQEISYEEAVEIVARGYNNPQEVLKSIKPGEVLRATYFTLIKKEGDNHE